LKILIILLIFIGEAACIYAEIMAAKRFASGRPFLQAFLKLFLIYIISGAFLISGYIFGFKAFRNIWVVSVVSITSILIVEPTLDLIIFQQWPTRGALIGLILGVIGFFSAIFYK